MRYIFARKSEVRNIELLSYERMIFFLLKTLFTHYSYFDSSGKGGAVYLSIVPSFFLNVFLHSLKYDPTVIQDILLPLLFISHVDIIICKQNETWLEGNGFALTENLK